MMTPEQIALRKRQIADEALLEIERGFAGSPVPPAAPSMAPAPAPLPPPPAQMTVPAGLEGSDRAGFVSRWIQDRAAQLAPPPSPPAPPSPAVRAPMFAGDGGQPPPPPVFGGVLPAAQHPIATPDPRPALPAQRPSFVPPPPPAGEAPPMRPPSRMAQMADGGGGPTQRPGGPDLGVIADIFPGLFPGVYKRRLMDKESGLQRGNRLAELAAVAQERAAERAAGAPGEAREAARFQWDSQDRASKAQAAAGSAEAQDPASAASKQARQVWAQAHPEFFAQRFGGAPEVFSGIAAGDSATWGMLNNSATAWEAQQARAGLKRSKGGGGAPGAGAASGAQESQAVMLIADGDIPGALAIADAIGGKAGQRIRDKAGQIAAAGAKVGEREGAKRAEAERRSGMPGWERDPGAPELSAAEAMKLRDGVAAIDSLRNIAARMKALDAGMSAADRIKAKMGIDTPQTAEALQLQRLTTTKIRQIANMGVPSLSEMAIANQQAPELSSASSFLNGTQRFDALVKAMEIETAAQMGARGYRRAGGGGAEKTATGPRGEKLVLRGGKWVTP